MVQHSHSSELDERSRSVLRTLIKEHVRSGQPVGSRRLSKIYHERLSPATLRNVMADLEEAGYLSQPHTSAGRIPTAAGYRYFVGQLLKSRVLPFLESGEIKKCLEEKSDPTELMSAASQLLSSYTNNIGIVLAPPIFRAVMKHIDFVRLSERRVLVILVSKAGLVQHHMIRLDEALAQSELDQAANYLTANFAGRSLLNIRAELVRLMSEERALYDRLLRNVVLLGSAALGPGNSEAEAEPQLFLDGTSRVLHRIDGADVERLIALFETLEEKKRLVQIISECITEGSCNPSVVIGLENHIPGMSNWSLITSPYRYDSHLSGTLGVLGPSRMEYDRAIGLVDYVARLFGQIMDSN
jgi:heat-inducible transcriptional repressor